MPTQNKIIGPKLFPWQRDAIKAIMKAGPHAQKIFVIKSKRQCGKSFMCEMELLRHSITYKNSVSIFVSLTYSNCAKVFKELTDFIEGAPFVKYINNGSMEIAFTNGSSIMFKSAVSRDNLRGLTVKGSGCLILDEAAYIPDDIYPIVLPYVNMFKCNVIMVSTPRQKAGMFYEYYKQGLENQNNIVSFDMSSYDTSEVLSQETVEMYRKILPQGQFRSEILGEFVDDFGGVFNITNDIWWESNKKYDDLFIGIDFGSGTQNDYTAISCFNSKAEQIFLEYTNTLNPNQQVEWIANFINSLDHKKIRKVYAETNSIGNVYISMLRQKVNKIHIEGFTTTNDSKRDIIEYMISRVNDSNIKLIKNEEQYREFSMYEMELTSTGKITYNGIPGTHDDCVMASAIALKGIKDLETNGNYTFGFTSNRQKIDRLRDKWK